MSGIIPALLWTRSCHIGWASYRSWIRRWWLWRKVRHSFFFCVSFSIDLQIFLLKTIFNLTSFIVRLDWRVEDLYTKKKNPTWVNSVWKPSTCVPKVKNMSVGRIGRWVVHLESEQHHSKFPIFFQRGREACSESNIPDDKSLLV